MALFSISKQTFNSLGRSLTALALRALKHPMVTVPIFAAFCLIVAETYPFSNFPMYSKFTNWTTYLYVCDGEGEAIPVRLYYPLAASRIKKKFVSKCKDWEKKTGRKLETISPEEEREIGDAILEGMRALTPVVNTPAGRAKMASFEPLQLVHVLIQRKENDEFVLTTRVVSTPYGKIKSAEGLNLGGAQP